MHDLALAEWQIKQRLKHYKKRLGKHTQRKLYQERNGRNVSARTIAAIDNNREWIEYYQKLIDGK